MSVVTLKLKVTKSGAAFMENTAVYHIAGDPQAYLVAVGVRIAGELTKGKHGHGPFSVELGGDIDGVAMPTPPAVSGISVADFHAFERTFVHNMLEMVNTSEQMNRAAGKL